MPGSRALPCVTSTPPATLGHKRCPKPVFLSTTRIGTLQVAPGGGGGAPVRTWRGHKGPVLAMAVDATGGLLASAGADRSCRVWDTEGFYCTHAFHGHRCAPSCGRAAPGSIWCG